MLFILSRWGMDIILRCDEICEMTKTCYGCPPIVYLCLFNICVRKIEKCVFIDLGYVWNYLNVKILSSFYQANPYCTCPSASKYVIIVFGWDLWEFIGFWYVDFWKLDLFIGVVWINVICCLYVQDEPFLQ